MTNVSPDVKSNWPQKCPSGCICQGRCVYICVHLHTYIHIMEVPGLYGWEYVLLHYHAFTVLERFKNNTISGLV